MNYPQKNKISKRESGNIGEQIAIEFLIKNRYKILERNYRVKNIGEIDIIAEKSEKLIFFEVKKRNVKHVYDFPIGFSINQKKRRNLKKICEIYLSNHNRRDDEWRVDALLISVDDQNKIIKTEHLENVLWESFY